MKPHSMWRLPAIGVVNLANTGGRREPCWNVGYRRIDILVAEGTQIMYDNITELLQIGEGLKREGWIICSWHSTTTGLNPADEADTALQAILLVKHLISGHLLNAETWYEGVDRWKTSAYWDRFQQGNDLPVAVWPMGSDTGEMARDFDYKTCIARGCMVYPQQYQNVNPTFMISSGDLNLKKAGVPVENRGTSPGTYIGAGATSVPWDAYANDLRILRRPVLCYAADLAGFDPAQAGKLVYPDVPVPDGEDDDMTVIGKNNGVTAAVNRLRDKDPGGTSLKKGTDGKWPSISTLASKPLDQWKAYDKLERSLAILVEDHDQMEV